MTVSALAWQDAAACRGVSTGVFFPSEANRAKRRWERAAEFCARCPVVAQCRAYVDSLEQEWSHGFWAGTTPQERKAARGSATGGRS